MSETPEEQAAFENELKDELIAKLGKLGVKADRRFSVAKLEEMLGNQSLEVPQEEAGPAPEPIPEPAPEPPGMPAGHVTVRITKHGAGKVFDGSGGTYPIDAMVTLPLAIAEQLEERAYAEIR